MCVLVLFAVSFSVLLLCVIVASFQVVSLESGEVVVGKDRRPIYLVYGKYVRK